MNISCIRELPGQIFRRSGNVVSTFDRWSVKMVVCEVNSQGYLNGEFIRYSEDGTISRHCVYVNGKIKHNLLTVSDKKKFKLLLKYGSDVIGSFV